MHIVDNHKKVRAFSSSSIVAKYSSLRESRDAHVVAQGHTMTPAGDRMSQTFDEALTRIMLRKSLSTHLGEATKAA